jgi:serine/threonine protein kinase
MIPHRIARFLRETRVLSQLRHPNVVRSLDVGTAGPAVFLVMEYERGPDAARVVRDRGPVAVRPAVKLVCQALAGLAHAHARGFVHRDVKPANLLIGRTGGKRMVKLADFGLARAYNESALSGLTFHGDVTGTPAFMAPEQITHYRDVGPAADQYSAAATLYHLLSAAYPHDLPKDLAGAFTAVLTSEPVPLRDRRLGVPEPVASAVHKALSRDPNARFKDIQDFARALARALL